MAACAAANWQGTSNRSPASYLAGRWRNSHAEATQSFISPVQVRSRPSIISGRGQTTQHACPEQMHGSHELLEIAPV